MVQAVVLEGRPDENRTGGTPSPLAMCLIACLYDAEHHSASSAAHIQRALAMLGSPSLRREKIRNVQGSRPQAVAACLSFLLPELADHSKPAADAVGEAIRGLRAQAEAEGLRQVSIRPIRH